MKLVFTCTVTCMPTQDATDLLSILIFKGDTLVLSYYILMVNGNNHQALDLQTKASLKIALIYYAFKHMLT